MKNHLGYEWRPDLKVKMLRRKIKINKKFKNSHLGLNSILVINIKVYKK